MSGEQEIVRDRSENALIRAIEKNASEFLKKGIGAAMTLTPLLEARSLGYEIGVLGASQMGYPVYKRIGFQKYCLIEMYTWKPEEG